MENGEIWVLVVAESILLLITLVALPAYAGCRARTKDLELRGLALPPGSVRSMLALIVVGSFVVFLIFGADLHSRKMPALPRS